MNVHLPRLIKEWEGNRSGWICRGAGFFAWDELPHLAWHKWVSTLIRMPDDIKAGWIDACKSRWRARGWDA